MSRLRFALVLLLLGVLIAPAAARQDPATVRRAVEDFLGVHIKGLPGQASFTVGNIEADNNLVPCPVMDAALPAGSRAWGKTSVQVRCRMDGGWTLYVPVQIRLMGEYLVAARPLTQGQVVSADDLLIQNGDLAELPAGVLTDPQQAVGRSAAVGMIAGRPLRSTMLREPMAIQQGQSVKLVSRGPGFQVAAEGRALNSAAEGQVAQARVASGRTLSGIARSGGTIELSP